MTSQPKHGVTGLKYRHLRTSLGCVKVILYVASVLKQTDEDASIYLCVARKLF